MAKTTKVCKRCGREIPKDAKICPACGGKAKLPFYRRWWFIVLVIIIVMTVWNNTAGKKIDESLNESHEKAVAEREYIETTVDQMAAELSDNALKAEDTYQDAYVAVEGVLGAIDSDGEYIGLNPLDGPITDSIHCTLTSDEQREAVKAHSKGDTIVVKGKITSIGELQGYFMDVDSIE